MPYCVFTERPAFTFKTWYRVNTELSRRLGRTRNTTLQRIALTHVAPLHVVTLHDKFSNHRRISAQKSLSYPQTNDSNQGLGFGHRSHHVSMVKRPTFTSTLRAAHRETVKQCQLRMQRRYRAGVLMAVCRAQSILTYQSLKKSLLVPPICEQGEHRGHLRWVSEKQRRTRCSLQGRTRCSLQGACVQMVLYSHLAAEGCVPAVTQNSV